MREILFRGKRKNGEWVYGHYNEWDGKARISGMINGVLDNVEVIPDKIGEFTGLCDKNGTKIFEGDIVKSEFLLGVVKYATAQEGFDGMCGFMVDDIYDGLQNYNGFWHQVEVIGNIYDNPELLKGE